MPHKSGKWNDVEITLVNRLDDPIRGIVAFLRVVTAEVAAQKGTQDLEDTLRTVFNGVHDGIFVHDQAGNIVHTNGKILEMFGISGHEMWELSSVDRYFSPSMNGQSLSEIWEQVIEGDVKLFEWKARRPSGGEAFDVEVFLRKIRLKGQNYILAAVRDITDRKRAEEQIKAALEEKEALLREIHHRVKNNLQVMSSLLRLQSRYIDKEQYREMFDHTESRVRSMALVHEQLYRSDQLGQVDCGKYLANLIGHLSAAHGGVGSNISVKLDVDEINLQPNTVVPLGLIITELVANALKHAFPDGRKGEVTVSLRAKEENRLALAVKDNGMGTLTEEQFEKSNSLGLRLVRIFADQLKGEIEIVRSTGTEFRLTFQVDTGV
jgi:PAS domain S-box-containing protein